MSKANIDGVEGKFFGSFCLATDLPDGYGVFKTNGWIHCGKVKHDCFTDGRKVSFNKKLIVVKSENTRS